VVNEEVKRRRKGRTATLHAFAKGCYTSKGTEEQLLPKALETQIKEVFYDLARKHGLTQCNRGMCANFEWTAAQDIFVGAVLQNLRYSLLFGTPDDLQDYWPGP
jgi:hypothetical protein